MDILDTFGDWLQLLFTASIGTLFIFALQLIARTALGSLIKTDLPIVPAALMGWIMWVSVYDYDIVIGWIISGLAFIYLGYQNPYAAAGLSEGGKKNTSSYFAIGLTLIGVMLAKIALFW